MACCDCLKDGKTSIDVYSVETSGFALTTAPTANYVLTSDASGNATWQPSPGGVPLTGSWTPQLLFNGSSAGIVYATPPLGTYVTPEGGGGNIVWISGSFQLSSAGSYAGDAIPTVAGLPFPVGSSVIPSNFACTWGNCPLDTNATTVTAHSVPGTSTFTLNMCYSTSSFEVALYFMFMSDTSAISFSGFYFTS